MTDKELIQALREVGDVEDMVWRMLVAADRLEALLRDNAALEREVQIQICKRSEVEERMGALLAENEHLRETTKMVGKNTNVPTKWVSVDERFPENNDKQVLVIVNGIYDGIHFHDAIEIAEFVWDEGWILESWPDWENLDVTFWQPLPEPPSTEGVE